MSQHPQAIQSNLRRRPQPSILLDGVWGEYMGDAIYGALDGTVTTFAVIAGAVGAQLSLPVVIIMAFANLFADGFSMSMGSLLSQRSQKQFIEREKSVISGLLKSDPQFINQLLSSTYRRKGLVATLVDQVVQTLMLRPEVVEAEILTEKKVIISSVSPVKSALVTFCSFILIGSLPVLPLLILPSINSWFVLFLVAAVLFLIGSLRCKITAVSWWRGGLEIMMAGLLASLIAYLVGDVLSLFFIS